MEGIKRNKKADEKYKKECEQTFNTYLGKYVLIPRDVGRNGEAAIAIGKIMSFLIGSTTDEEGKSVRTVTFEIETPYREPGKTEISVNTLKFEFMPGKQTRDVSNWIVVLDSARSFKEIHEDMQLYLEIINSEIEE